MEVDPGTDFRRKRSADSNPCFCVPIAGLAVFVLIAGALGEMTELYALWQADYSNVLSDIVFSTTALLVILLTAELSLQIPGLWLVTFSTIDLRLSIDEELRWSGVCARSSGRPG